MPEIAAVANGPFEVGATWAGGLVPGPADWVNYAGFTVTSGSALRQTVKMRSSVANGTLIVSAGTRFECTGTGTDCVVANLNLTVTLLGSGDYNNPTIFAHGGRYDNQNNWKINFQGTVHDGTSKADIKVLALDAVNSTWYPSGGFTTTTNNILDRVVFEDYKSALYGTGPLSTLFNNHLLYSKPFKIGDWILNNCGTATYLLSYAQINTTDTLGVSHDIIINGALSTNALYNCKFYGGGRVIIKNNTVSSKGKTSLSQFYDSVTLRIEDLGGLLLDPIFNNSSKLDVIGFNGTTIFSGAASIPEFLDDSEISIILAGAAAIGTCYGTNLAVVNTTGRQYYEALTATTFGVLAGLYACNWKEIVVKGGVAITNVQFISSVLSTVQPLWASRTKMLRVISALSVTHYNGVNTCSAQYEPLIYFNGAEGIYTDLRISGYLNPNCKNRSTVYTGSGLTWSATAASVSIAAGGYIEFDMSALLADGWTGLPFKSLTGFATLVESVTGGMAGTVATWYVSHDAGATWSAPLTLAQIITGIYTINGLVYTVNPYQHVMIKPRWTNATGGPLTITGFLISGLSIDGTVFGTRTLFGMHDMTHDRQGIPVDLGTGADHSKNLFDIFTSLGAGIGIITTAINVLKNYLYKLYLDLLAKLLNILAILNFIRNKVSPLPTDPASNKNVDNQAKILLNEIQDNKRQIQKSVEDNKKVLDSEQK